MEENKKNKVLIISSCIIAVLVIVAVIGILPQMRLKTNKNNNYNDERSFGDVACATTQNECPSGYSQNTSTGGCMKSTSNGKTEDECTGSNVLWYMEKCYDTTSMVTVCTSCSSAYAHVNSNGKCVCNSGYEESGNGCIRISTATKAEAEIKSCENKVYDGTSEATCTVELKSSIEGVRINSNYSCSFESTATDKIGQLQKVTCSNVLLAGTNASNYYLESSTLTKNNAAKITSPTCEDGYELNATGTSCVRTGIGEGGLGDNCDSASDCKVPYFCDTDQHKCSLDRGECKFGEETTTLQKWTKCTLPTISNSTCKIGGAAVTGTVHYNTTADTEVMTCTCNEGYELNSAGTACKKSKGQACENNSDCNSNYCFEYSSGDIGKRCTNKIGKCGIGNIMMASFEHCTTLTNSTCTSGSVTASNGEGYLSANSSRELRCSCDEGYRPNEDNTACVSRTAPTCKKGEYRRNIGGNEVICEKCAGNTYTDTTDATECKDIPDHSSVNSDNSGFICDTNYFKNDSSTECIQSACYANGNSQGIGNITWATSEADMAGKNLLSGVSGARCRLAASGHLCFKNGDTYVYGTNYVTSSYEIVVGVMTSAECLAKNNTTSTVFEPACYAVGTSQGWGGISWVTSESNVNGKSILPGVSQARCNSVASGNMCFKNGDTYVWGINYITSDYDLISGVTTKEACEARNSSTQTGDDNPGNTDTPTESTRFCYARPSDSTQRRCTVTKKVNCDANEYETEEACLTAIGVKKEQCWTINPGTGVCSQGTSYLLTSESCKFATKNACETNKISNCYYIMNNSCYQCSREGQGEYTSYTSCQNALNTSNATRKAECEAKAAFGYVWYESSKQCIANSSCGAGYYRGENGCVPCKAGYACPGGNGSMYECPAGSTQNQNKDGCVNSQGQEVDFLRENCWKPMNNGVVVDECFNDRYDALCPSGLATKSECETKRTELITRLNKCDVTISTESKYVSKAEGTSDDNSYYEVTVTVASTDSNTNYCVGQTITYSATNGRLSKTTDFISGTTTGTYTFNVYPIDNCKQTSATATLSNGKSSTVTLPHAVKTDWKSHTATDCWKPTGSYYTSAHDADTDRLGGWAWNTYYDQSTTCSDGSSGYKIKWTRQDSCGGGGSSVQSYSCYADDSDIKKATKWDWLTGPADELKYKITTDVEGKKLEDEDQCIGLVCYANASTLTEATQTAMLSKAQGKLTYQIKTTSGEVITDLNQCKPSACYKNSSHDYKWATVGSLDSSYTKVDNITTEANCKNVASCMIKVTKDKTEIAWAGNQDLITKLLGEGYEKNNASEENCVITAKCYNKGSEYKMSTTPLSGYTEVSLDMCKDNPASSEQCYTRKLSDGSIEYVWGKYDSSSEYAPIDIERDYCSTTPSCYKNIAKGTYHTGDYSLNDEYSQVDASYCTVAYDVPSTAANRQTVIYVGLVLLALSGVGLIYYGNYKRKKA